MDKPVRVGIVQLGEIDEKYDHLAHLEIESFYRASVVGLGKMVLSEASFYSPRNRYRADLIIEWLREIKPDTIDLILGLTSEDISTTKGEHKDWGVMGLGYLPGSSCVVSTFRLKKGAGSEKHIEERFSKIVLHELGHNFGLEHCSSKTCLMKDACGTVKSIDGEKKQVCEKCRKHLKKLKT